MTATTPDEHAERIRALDEAWMAAAARRDLDAMMSIYAEDARELLPDMHPLTGRDVIRAFYRRLIDRFPRFAHEFTPEEITVAESGELAVVQGTYRFTPDTLGAEEVQVGKFVGVWRRRAGDWQLQVNISNGSPTNPDSP